jgi:hypothetical protein
MVKMVNMVIVHGILMTMMMEIILIFLITLRLYFK